MFCYNYLLVPNKMTQMDNKIMERNLVGKKEEEKPVAMVHCRDTDLIPITNNKSEIPTAKAPTWPTTL